VKVSKKQLLRIIHEELLRYEQKTLREAINGLLIEVIYDQSCVHGRWAWKR